MPASIKPSYSLHAYRRPCFSLQKGKSTNNGSLVGNNCKISSEQFTLLSLIYHRNQKDHNVIRLPQSVHIDVKLFLSLHRLANHETRGVGAARPCSSRQRRTYNFSSCQPLWLSSTRINFRELPSASLPFFTYSTVWVIPIGLCVCISSVPYCLFVHPRG